VSGDHVVVDLAARQHLGEFVPDQLADAKLPLGWACAGRPPLVTHFRAPPGV
jgi:hypothetical protein